MSAVFAVLATAGAVFFAGYQFGTLARMESLFELCRNQQDRGDYWFDKYQEAIRDGWESVEDED